MKSRNYFSRADYIKYQLPAGDKLSDAIAYVYEANGHPYAVVFYGEQAKPVSHYRYSNETEREKSVTQAFEARQAHDKAKSEAAEKRSAAVATVKFEVGKTYHDRSSCDYDTIYSFEILSRTAKQLTIKEHDNIYKRGIYVYEGVEHCKPHGTYSMCSVISANRESA